MQDAAIPGKHYQSGQHIAFSSMNVAGLFKSVATLHANCVASSSLHLNSLCFVDAAIAVFNEGSHVLALQEGNHEEGEDEGPADSHISESDCMADMHR